jgi:diguanylate cyclase (GGDEF)-like protein
MDLAQGLLRLPEVRPRLLMMDDEPLNIQTLYRSFAADHQVFIATTGEQALALCASKHPDLILLDVEMPGMDGYEVCRRLKADTATRDVPVIFVTAHNDEVSEARALDAGAVDFITKPVNPRIVRARVKTHLTLKTQSDLLRQWVYTDGLTGVRNRRYFDERLAEEWGRARRDKSDLGVLMLDVDFFKRFNDLYGHQAGDECLRRIAVALKNSLKRQGDLVARYGGEEFVCLMPNTGLEGAMHLARALCSRVHDQQIPHADSSIASVVTASVGVCSASGSNVFPPEALVRAADAQLYLAKSLGRNQTCGSHLAAFMDGLQVDPSGSTDNSGAPA